MELPAEKLLPTDTLEAGIWSSPRLGLSAIALELLQAEKLLLCGAVG